MESPRCSVAGERRFACSFIEPIPLFVFEDAQLAAGRALRHALGASPWGERAEA